MFALMVVGIVLYVKLFNSGMIGVEEYKLHSHFEKALGLNEGTKVQISGVDVGKISAIHGILQCSFRYRSLHGS